MRKGLQFWVAPLLLVTTSSCAIELEHGLDERQANEVTTVLVEAGLSADKEPEEGSTSYKVLVPRTELPRAFALLEAHGLPHLREKGVAELFSDASLLPSPLEEQARFLTALGADLERTLEKFPAVASARVHLAVPEEHSLVPKSSPAQPSAAVLLRLGHAHPSAPAPSPTEVQRLVAAAVAGLDPERVQVVVTQAPEVPVGPDGRGPLLLGRRSRTATTTLVASGLVLVLLLSLGLFVTARRLSALQKRLRQFERA